MPSNLWTENQALQRRDVNLVRIPDAMASRVVTSDGDGRCDSDVDLEGLADEYAPPSVLIVPADIKLTDR
jgi:hypothetical protein